MMVLAILLITSSFVEIYLCSHQTKISNLSFAVLNLDSLHAREYARIPLIESFQATYYYIFGICESFLTEDIPNEDIFIIGFPRRLLDWTKWAIIKTGVFAYVLRKICQLKRGFTLKFLKKLLILKVT